MKCEEIIEGSSSLGIHLAFAYSSFDRAVFYHHPSYSYPFISQYRLHTLRKTNPDTTHTVL